MQSPAPTPPPSLSVARIVWGAMLVAVAGYAALVPLLGTAVGAGRTPVDALRPVFLAVAVAETIGVWLLNRRVLAPALERPTGAPAAVSADRIFTMLVVCWALAESIAIFGLVLAMLSGRVGVGLPFFAWSLALLLWTRPQPDYF